MLKIDNTETVKQLLLFEKNSSRFFYKFAVIVRRKDYESKPVFMRTGSHEICVHQWLVSSLEEYEKLLPEMLKTAELFEARLYVALDRKDLYKALLQVQKSVSETLASIVLGQTSLSAKSFSKLINSASSVKESSASVGKCWLFDVDAKNLDLVRELEKLCEESHICTLETRAGFHIVARKNFNAKALNLPKEVELKENALGLVAM